MHKLTFRLDAEYCDRTHLVVFKSDHSRGRWVTIMLSSEPLKTLWSMGKREGESFARITRVCWQNPQRFEWVYHLRSQCTREEHITHPLCGGLCGQDDLLDISVVFWNIPIHGVVGMIFLESPNMGHIPQTLKLSHPA